MKTYNLIKSSLLIIGLLIININQASARVDFDTFMRMSPEAKTLYNNTIGSGGDANLVTTGNGQSVLVVGNSSSQANDWSNNVSNSSSFDEVAELMVDTATGEGMIPYQTSNSAGCNNGAGLLLTTYNTGTGSGGSTSTPSTPSGTSTSTNPIIPPSPPSPPPPPPPPPSCTYISSWTASWSSCLINSNWSSSGIISCKQSVSYSANTTTLARNTCPSNAIKPSISSATTLVSMDFINTTNGCSNIYANNSDQCNIIINISGATKQDKAIVGLNNQVVKNIKNNTKEPADRVNGGFDINNNNALIFNTLNDTKITGSGNNFQILLGSIKSIAPFTTDTGKIEFEIEGINSFTNIKINNIKYYFKKPYIGNLESSIDGINWNQTPSIGTQLKYKLNPIKDINITIDEYKLLDFKSKIQATSSDLEIQNIKIENDTLNNLNGTIFEARINTSSSLINDLPEASLQVNMPVIQYEINGKLVAYYLSENSEANDTSPIKITGNKFIGVKIIGNLQGDGKQTITGQDYNISNINNITVKNEIKKNAFILTKTLNNNEPVNGIQYVEGDISISGEQNYETLIVKNGNVTIKGDLNISGKKLGIIVLNDGYDTKSDYVNKGNIYIDNNVGYINAIIYSDGGIISSYNGTPYIADNINRTQQLQKQLVIKGSIFTKNTIGGAILSGGEYILPEGKTTNDFDNAMIYDLNYIRRGNQGWETNSNNAGYKNSFVIIYNPDVQTDPPKGFEQ